MNIQQIIKKRRIVKRYKIKVISKNLINKIVEAGRWALSIHGFQRWKFLVIRDRSLIEEVSKILINIPPFKLISPEKFNFKKWTPVQRLLAELYIPYFNFTVKFLSEKTQEILKNRYNFEIPQITEDNLIKVFEYCVKRGFIRQKVKTVWKY